LRVNHTEDGIGVGFAVDVSDAPVVAGNGDIFGLLLPTSGLRVRRGLRGAACRQGEEERSRSNEDGEGNSFHNAPGTGAYLAAERIGGAEQDSTAPPPLP